MLSHIIPLIPKHIRYIEPFAGGAAVFWAKEPSPVEILNDTNKELINFYQVLKSDFGALRKEITATLHSRETHDQAWVVYNNAGLFTPVKRAWAIWTLAYQSYGSKLNGNWKYSFQDDQISKVIQHKKDSFTHHLAERLQHVHIECADAIYIIETRDTEESFFYCDPPYFNSNMGHYKGYTHEDFKKLLTALTKIKGKFLLSSYPSETLFDFAQIHSWQVISTDKPLSIHVRRGGKMNRKTEVLTANYKIV
jgi:DNA adenine methylase